MKLKINKQMGEKLKDKQKEQWDKKNNGGTKRKENR